LSTNLAEGIEWVGCIDWAVRDFHGYETDRGTSYNAYLIRDEKTVLVDAVRDPFADRLLANVADLVDFEKVDHVICHHAELDHAGAFPEVLRAMPNASIICNSACRKALGDHFDISGWKFEIVKTGNEMSIGSKTLQFINTPMVHWPESMATFVPEDGILFSMDAFGQHYACSGRFDDEASLPTALEEAQTYYANIGMPYGKPVGRILRKLDEGNLRMIAPSHGVIWRRHVSEILQCYRDWSSGKVKNKVLVVYDSMWASTARMAETIAKGAAQEGSAVQLCPIRGTTFSRVAKEMSDSGAVAFGSSTLNGTMMPMAAAVLSYYQGLKPAPRAALAFGSHGWSGGGADGIDAGLKSMDWEVVREPLKVRYRPTPEVLEECLQAGKLLASKAREYAGREG
jgi:flavorubredoxin